jgi:hypothetical protein
MGRIHRCGQWCGRDVGRCTGYDDDDLEVGVPVIELRVWG